MIRLANADDNENIAKVSIAGWQHAYKELFPDELLDNLKWEQRVEGRNNFFADINRISLVCELDQKIVGFCDFGPARLVETVSNIDATFGEIYAIYVLPQYQKQGIGKSLFIAAIDSLQKQTYKSVAVWTLVTNKPAIEFYMMCGCNITRWHKGFVMDDKEYPEVALVYDLEH
jgi:ribosomal protein S18 acetylase RimI-like enzyme